MSKRFLIVLAAILLIFAVPAVYADEPGDSNSVGSGDDDPWGGGTENPNPPKANGNYDSGYGDNYSEIPSNNDNIFISLLYECYYYKILGITIYMIKSLGVHN
jgi:hypothetical protein